MSSSFQPIFEASLPHSPHTYRRSPKWTSDGALQVREWVRALGASREVAGMEEWVDFQWLADRSLHESNRRIASREDAQVDLEAKQDGEHVRLLHHEQGPYEVWLHRSEESILVWSACALCAAPSLARRNRNDALGSGTWVAFHHSLREDSLETDIAKWIAIRFVTDDGRVLEPEASMSDRQRDLAGVEQSFEFPELLPLQCGGLIFSGRGSQNFFLQSLGSNGFSQRQPLTNGEWASRGRRASLWLSTDGDEVRVAFRGRNGIDVVALASQALGPPAMQAAVVSVASSWPTAAYQPPLGHQTPRRIFFGDLQQHSAHSDGVGTAAEAHLRARDVYGDDFVALTDHEAFVGKRTSPVEWAYLQDVADSFLAPNFVPIYAYEWTAKMYPGPGHKCVYWQNKGMPLWSRDDVPEGRELTELVASHGALCAPHHIGWTGCDADGHRPDAQPFWEIVSCHGAFETAGHPLGMRGDFVDQLADVQLRAGLQFGFVGGSDSHGLLWHHGEARKRDPYRTGLTAILATELSREALFEALRARRCYATSGAKIELYVEANGQPMGSSIAGAMNLTGRVVGTHPIARVEVITEKGITDAHRHVSESELEANFSCSVVARFAYVRVTQSDGETAWSSPWFAE